MPTFRSLHNPDFRLRTWTRTIQFTGGQYTTADPDEIAVLRRADGVEEVKPKPTQPYASRKRQPASARTTASGAGRSSDTETDAWKTIDPLGGS